jgi:heme/copper-type cytochrome/quinol oxidase subunit 3
VAALRARGGTSGNALWLAALFWDFVTVVWVIIYATVFWL